jgi:arginyl-tRNA--protein-N-Asp/Glu arginylyltransferase
METKSRSHHDCSPLRRKPKRESSERVTTSIRWMGSKNTMRADLFSLSCRVPVADFQMNSMQKKAWKRNQDLTMTVLPTRQAAQIHYDLYHK